MSNCVVVLKQFNVIKGQRIAKFIKVNIIKTILNNRIQY